MLKTILNEIKLTDKTLKRLCSILENCNLNENKYKSCDQRAFNFKLDFYNEKETNHLKRIFMLTWDYLFNAEWSALDDEPFYEMYNNLIRNPDSLNDKEFIEMYCYVISGITRSWLNFSKSPTNDEVEYFENAVKFTSQIEVYNSNIDTFNKMLIAIRKLVKLEVDTCDYFDLEVNDKTFELIQNGLQLQRI